MIAAALAVAVLAGVGARAPVAWADEPAATGDAAGPWEDVVYLPEAGLATLLERDPRGVLLDRASYVDLHRRAREARGGAENANGPAVRLLRCDVEGVVEGDRARLRVRLDVESHEPGLATLAFALGGSVTASTLDGAAATLGADAKGALVLSVRGRGVHQAVVEVVAPVTTSAGARSVRVDLPAAAVSRWTLEIPGRVTPVAEESLWRTERLRDPDRTRLVAYGARSALRAAWREGDRGTDLPPLVRADVRTLALIGERSLEATVLLRITCLRSPLDAFVVDLPPDLSVLGVEGEGASLLPGDLGAGDGAAPPPGRHVLRFAEAFTGVHTVLIRASRPLPGPGTVDLPVVGVPGAATVDRILAVRFTDGLRGVVDPGPGATRLDAALSEQGAVDALLRLEAGAAPRARSERPAVLLRADVRVLLDLAEDGPWLAVSFLYLPRGDRLYGVDPLLPPGFTPETVTVSGDRVFLRGTTPDGRLSLVFPGGVAAGGAVTVSVRGRWPVPGWDSDDAAERTAPLPRLDAGTLAETEGWLGVAVPPGTEVREEETSGLVPAAVSELRERAAFTTADLALGWRFRGGVPGGRLRVTRPAASVTSSVVLLAVPAEDHVSLEGAVTVQVQRGGTRELRLRVTPAIGDLLRIDGIDVAEKRRSSDPSDAKGDLWTVRLLRRIRDGTTLTLRADLPLEDGAAAVPAVAVEGATRQELLVGVAAAGELEVTMVAHGLREADPANMVPAMGARAGGLLAAWRAEREGTPSLVVRTARLPAAPLPAAFADSLVLRTVLGMDGIARTRLDAQIRNADRQALEVTLPAGARLDSARVAGLAVRPVLTSSGRLLVPIVPSAAPFPVVLFYEEALAEGGAASLRAPDLGIPGSFAVWTVHLPEGSFGEAADGDFSEAPRAPADPLCVRVVAALLDGVTSVGGMTLSKSESGPPAEARAAGRAARRPPAAPPSPAEEAPGLDDKPDAAGGKAGPAPPRPQQERIDQRAAQRGLFGMDLRLLAAGPEVTASRLGGTGTLHLRWRSAASRATWAVLAAIAAFLAALLARRSGVGTPTWTVLALGFLTAAPIVLGVEDPSAWDGAALGTALFAALALVRAVAGRVRLRRVRRAPGGASATPAAVVSAFVLCALSGVAPADDAARNAPGPAVPADRVYVPYDPARPETLRAAEEVFLPYARYRELWNAAHPEVRIEHEAPPVLVGAVYEGRVEGESDGRTLMVSATFDVDPVDGGVVALPPGAAVDDLRVDGRPASATALAPGGATLVPVAKGASPGARVRIEATLRWAVAGDAPGGAVKAALPRAPSATLSIEIPLGDPVVHIVAAGGFTTSATATGQTQLVADLGPVDALDLRWQPRGADATGGRTRFEVDTESVATLGPGLLTWSAQTTLRVLAGTVHELRARVPAGLEVLGVEGAGVASWTVTRDETGDDAGPTLVVRLLGIGPGESNVSTTGILRVTGAGEPVMVPDLDFAGASSDRHRVAVSAADGRLAVVESSGMERTDAAAGAAPGSLAFRRVRSPARLTVRLDPLEGELTVSSRQRLHLGAEDSRLSARFSLVPGPRGLFEARVAIPDGWTLEFADGAASYREGADVRLVLPGAPSASRSFALGLRGPVAGAEPFAFPLLRVAGATRESAELLVSTAPGYGVSVASVDGLEPVPADRFADWPAIDPAETRALAWRDPRGGGAVSLRREALRPTLRPTVVADISVFDDRVIVDALVAFDVKGGPERTFRVDAPPGVDGAWVLGEGLREVRRERVGDRERLTVTMQAASAGTVAFRVLYDVPVPPSGSVVVAGPEPVGGEGARAFLLIRALGESEVQIGADPRLETCDFADLPLVPEGLDPLRVLRFLRARDTAWQLPLTLVAHGFGELPAARVHLVEATTVADRDGSARTRVDVRIFSRTRAFLPVALPEAASLEVVLVQGEPVRPVTRPSEPALVQVPIRVQSLGEESQTVSLTYRTPPVAPGSRFSSLEPRLPEFPGVPVDATTWRLVLPADREYSFSGNMDEIEEVEVAMSRAEAYVSDLARLRVVVEKGSRQQQVVALENYERNTRELQDSLELAKSQLDELATAATEGRVDGDRLVASRRKAAELTREMEQALADVRRNAAAQQEGPPPDSRAPATQQPSRGDEGDEQARLATKEGQSYKRWGANDANVEARSAQSRAQGGVYRGPAGEVPPDGREPDAAKSPGAEEASSALSAHAQFEGPGASGRRDDPLAGIEAGAAAPQDGGPGPSTGGADAGGGAAPTRTIVGLVHGRGALDRGRGGSLADGTAATGAYLFGGGGGGGVGPGFGGAGGGGGGDPGDAFRTASPVQGLVSLAPPLVEQGRVYAFRKLDANASVEVNSRTPDLGRRAVALAGFLALVGLVWWLRSRRAARRRSA